MALSSIRDVPDGIGGIEIRCRPGGERVARCPFGKFWGEEGNERRLRREVVKLEVEVEVVAGRTRKIGGKEQVDVKERLESAANPYGLNQTMELFSPCRSVPGSVALQTGEEKIRDNARPRMKSCAKGRELGIEAPQQRTAREETGRGKGRRSLFNGQDAAVFQGFGASRQGDMVEALPKEEGIRSIGESG